MTLRPAGESGGSSPRLAAQARSIADPRSESPGSRSSSPTLPLPHGCGKVLLALE